MSLYKGGPLGPMPGWFGNALKRKSAGATRMGEPAAQPTKGNLRYLVRLKSAQSQQRNVQRVLHVLAGGKARFMGRAWREGR